MKRFCSEGYEELSKAIMHLWRTFLLLTILPALVLCAPSALPFRATLPPKYSVLVIGNATSTIPNIYRDGGGGGQINGLNFIWFADGITTTGGEPNPNFSNWINFTSNSIAYSGYNGGGPSRLLDFGETSPRQQIPFFYDNGEADQTTGIWPNENFASLCSGHCGVGFPPVIRRTASVGGGGVLLYNTGVSISVGAYGPVVSRPIQAIFYPAEPQFGTFSSYAENDGYLYTFAAISNTTANGLKMARVTVDTPFTKSAYQYWNGKMFSREMPKIDDGGVANIFNFTNNFFGQLFGPGSGDFFYSNYYGVYMIIFGAADAAIDSSVYMVYSSSMTSGWSAPVAIYETPRMQGGYNYNIHAYPMYDSARQVIPITWTQFDGTAYYNAFANITFS